MSDLSASTPRSSQSQVAIALGSNLGNPRAILTAAFQELACMPQSILIAHSQLYQTVAIGPPQPDYLNACALVQTALSPQAVLHHLLNIEAQFGRERRERWGARLLDLDLLLYDDWVLDEPGLTVPHPRMTERAFMLVPLAEVAPDWIEPVTGKAIAELVQAVDCSTVHPLNEPSAH